MSDNKTKNSENKNNLQLPPKDLTYRVLMERSAQIKAGDSTQLQQQNAETASKSREKANAH